MKNLTKHFNLYLLPRQDAWLESESLRTGSSQAEIIRRALDEYQEKREGIRPLKSIKEKPRENR